MFCTLCLKSIADIPFGCELLPDLFPFLWIGGGGGGGGGHQILFLEFSKDSPADNRYEFTYGASTDYTVIL